MPAPETPTFTYAVGTFEALTYYARVAWVTASGQEGMPSELTTYDAPAGSVPVVAVGNAPANAAGFNVYLGFAGQPLAKQNSSPVAVGDSFTVAPGGLVAGAGPGNGQAPDIYLTGTRVMRRG
ncbi:MAG: hypothetical protein WDO18_21060 [Acidobacteriota bacterium]